MKIILFASLIAFSISSFSQNTLPVINPDTIIVAPNETVIIDFTLNDFDADGDILKFFGFINYPDIFELIHPNSSQEIKLNVKYGYPGFYFITYKIREVDSLTNAVHSTQTGTLYVEVVDKQFTFLDINNHKASFISQGTMFWNLDKPQNSWPR